MADVDAALLCSIEIMYSDNGIGISNSFNTTIRNTTLNHVDRGIAALNTSKILILYTIICNFSEYGVFFHENQDSVMANVTIVFAQLQEVALKNFHSHNIIIENILLSQVGAFKLRGVMFVFDCKRVAISKSVFAKFSSLQFPNTFMG